MSRTRFTVCRGWVAAILLPLLIVALGCQSGGERRPAAHAVTVQPTGDTVRSARPPNPSSLGVVAARAEETTAAAPPPPAPDAGRTAAPPPCAEYPIDLATALALAGSANPTIALAQEAVRASEAERLQADALLLPTLHAGADVNIHRGNLESSRGLILDVDRQSAYVGGGAAAVGAGTVNVPGVRVVGHLADALFEPLAARQRVTGASFEALATRNTTLLDVAVRYFDLLGAEARLAAARQSEAEFREVADLTANFARTGQGRQADADRAQGDLLLVRAEVVQAAEVVATAAAELARLLSLDPTTRLRPADDLLAPVTLVPPGERLERLVQLAVSLRPEVGARSAAVAFGETRLREERVRPFVPLLSVGYSAGGFGGGSDLVDTRFGHFSGRADFDAAAVWSLANFGLGNLAVQRQRQAAIGEAEAERQRVIDQVRREVAEAFGLAAARRQELESAQRQLTSAREGARLDLLRARNLEGRPIEVLNSLRLLDSARQDLIRATVRHNQAEYQLFVALGQPPTLAVTVGD